jgi:hypothetical protein
MAIIPGSHLNLHAYDEVGRHVGYFPVTDSDQVQIPNATYTGNISNPEIIMIPNASSKNYTIKVDATQFTSSSPTPVEVYAIETPVRPAVLGISPVELYPFISPGETKNITMQLAEVGKQVDIEGVTITPHGFTDIYENSMPNVTISISPNNFNIDKGIITFVNLNLNASENVTLPSVPETRYTGNITINTSNAGEINATLSVLILETYLPNAKLTFAEPNVTGAHALGLDLSAIDEAYKPPGVTPQSAYMINSTGAGNFTLKFTNIPKANTIIVYKINATNHWIPLDTTTTANTVTFTMSVGDPPVVFGFFAPIGGFSVAILPKIKPANAGASCDFTVRIRNTQNFDENVVMDLTLSGIPVEYAADPAWFNWTTSTLSIPAGEYSDIGLRMDIPDGFLGYKSFGIIAHGTFGDSKDYGVADMKQD